MDGILHRYATVPGRWVPMPAWKVRRLVMFFNHSAFHRIPSVIYCRR